MTSLQRTLFCVFGQSHFRLVRRHVIHSVGHFSYNANSSWQTVSNGAKGSWVGIQSSSRAVFHMCQQSYQVMGRHKDSKNSNKEDCVKGNRERSKLKKKHRKHSRSTSSENREPRRSIKKQKKKEKRKKGHEEKKKLKRYARKLRKIRRVLDCIGASFVKRHSPCESEPEVQIIYDSRQHREKNCNILKRYTSYKEEGKEVICLDKECLNAGGSGGPEGASTTRCTAQTGAANRLSGLRKELGDAPESGCIVVHSALHKKEVEQEVENATFVASTSAGESGCSAMKRDNCGFTNDRDEAVVRKLGDRINWDVVKMDVTTAGAQRGAVGSGPDMLQEHFMMFDIVSYNVLAQEIMEDHMYLYRNNTPESLNWAFRSKLLMKQFLNFNADILCLQEVQQTHLKSFYSELNNVGYSGLYKQRTGNRADGVAIYYKNETFELIDYATVEYYQPGVAVLNRDNVGLVAKFAPKKKPDVRVVVATTHLLFNPNRHDIKLAQIQILLAEVERFAFKKFDQSTGSSTYWPVIMTGDMNFEPSSGEYKFLCQGWFKFEGLGNKKLTENYGRPLARSLIPPSLGITDTCQHWNILLHRNVPIPFMCQRPQQDDHMAELAVIQLYNSDYRKLHVPPNQIFNPYQSQYTSTAILPDVGFGTGELSHRLNLTSVYNHNPEDESKPQVSTFQDDWVVVDYIFYSHTWDVSQPSSNLRLVARYKMLSQQEAERVGPIPNAQSPSDHYPLAAKFALIF